MWNIETPKDIVSLWNSPWEKESFKINANEMRKFFQEISSLEIEMAVRKMNEDLDKMLDVNFSDKWSIDSNKNEAREIASKIVEIINSEITRYYSNNNMTVDQLGQSLSSIITKQKIDSIKMDAKFKKNPLVQYWKSTIFNPENRGLIAQK